MELKLVRNLFYLVLLIAQKFLALLVADYVMDENTGYTLTNSVTSGDALGVAYLGKPSYLHQC